MSLFPIHSFNIRIFIGSILAMLSVPLYFFVEAGVDIYKILIPLIFLIQIYLLWRFRNIQMLQIITLYIFLYFIFLIPYFYFNMELSQYSEFQKDLYFEKVLYLFYLFYSGAFIASAWEINPHRIKLNKEIQLKPDKTIKILYLIIVAIAVVLMFREGVNVLDASSPYMAYRENLNNTSSISLFVILLLFFLPYLYSSKLLYYSILSLVFFYCVTRGFRMVLAPLLLLIFFHKLDLKFRFRLIFILFILSFLFMGYVNSLKMGQKFKLIYSFTENPDYVLSHQADALYISASTIGLIDSNEITFSNRILLTIGFLSESIIPPTLLPDTIKFPHVVSLHARTGGGGLFIPGAYLMWGSIGVILCGFLLVFLFKISYNTNNIMLKLLISVIFIFSPRWISYDFHLILRFSVYIFIIYFLLNNIHVSKTLKKNNIQ